MNSIKNYNVFYHQTDEKSANNIIKNGFNTPEVWAAPDDEGNYGESVIIIYAPKPKKPFYLDINNLFYDLNIPYENAQEIIKKNYKLYQNLGGEINPETFNKLRGMGYDEIIEDNGDRCFLYPDKLKYEKQNLTESYKNRLQELAGIVKNNLPNMQSMIKKYNLRYPKKNTLIIVNIDKLLAKHKIDNPNYAFDSKETSDYPKRIDRAKEYWTKYAEDQKPISPDGISRLEKNWGKIILEAPLVSIWEGKLGISDGRHRIIAMKELGYDDIIIEIPKNQINLFNELK